MIKHCASVLMILLLMFSSINLTFGEPLEAALARAAPSANPKVIALAVHASQCKTLQATTPIQRLAVIDYSRPSTEQRLWVFDLTQRTLLFQELVAHGRNSGENLATRFSNADGSKTTSLGLYRTQAAYNGDNGYSLRMEGLEPGFNDNALARDIVIHGAAYVSADLARSNGRIGRSWGCPAVRPEVAKPLIDAMKDGQLLLAYYPDPQWLSESRFLNCQ